MQQRVLRLTECFPFHLCWRKHPRNQTEQLEADRKSVLHVAIGNWTGHAHKDRWSDAHEPNGREARQTETDKLFSRCNILNCVSTPLIAYLGVYSGKMLAVVWTKALWSGVGNLIWKRGMSWPQLRSILNWKALEKRPLPHNGVVWAVHFYYFQQQTFSALKHSCYAKGRQHFISVCLLLHPWYFVSLRNFIHGEKLLACHFTSELVGNSPSVKCSAALQAKQESHRNTLVVFIFNET